MAKRKKKLMPPLDPTIPTSSQDTEHTAKTNKPGLRIMGRQLSYPGIRGKQLSHMHMAAFVVAFAAIGTSLVFFSQAAPAVIATMEAENMALPAGASVIPDSTASGANGGSAVVLTQVGTSLTGSVTIPSSAESLMVTAKGTKCKGSWPSMTVSVGGVTVLGPTQVSSSSWKSYSVTKTLAAGTPTLDIKYAAARAGCTSKLYVDVTNFYGPAPVVTPAPTVNLSASPTSVTAGGSSTLSWSSTNATACTLDGGIFTNSSQPTSSPSGGLSTGALSTATTYDLSCSGAGGTRNATTTVTIASSTVTQIPSTIKDDCSVDVTTPILNWIASVPNNSTLTFGTGKCYRIDGTLEVKNRSGLVFEGNGSTFSSPNRPATDSAADQQATWRVIDSTGFKFNNMTIDGWYANGGVHEPALQHAHAIDLRGTNAEIANVTMSDLAGDCVYFGQGYTSALTRSSGSVHDSSCSRIGRNAVSVTAGNDIRVERMTTSAIGYIVFDVEPNVGPGWGSDRVTFNNNTIGSYYLSAYSIVQNAPITDQAFTNNRVSGRGLKVTMGDPGGKGFRPRNVTVTGNSSDTAQAPAAMNIDNIDIFTATGNTVPMTSGHMAAIDNSCGVNVSGNSYPGGTTEVIITNPKTGC